MRNIYGDKVEVEYIDLADSSRHEEFKLILQAVEDYHWAYPLVAIEGALRMAGGIDVAMITDEIDKVLQEAER